MNLYELTYILRSDLEEDAVQAVQDRITGRIGDLDGEILKSEGWGRRRLAYPIERVREGFYYTSILRLAPDRMEPLEAQLRLVPEVLRFLVIAQEEKNINLNGSLIPSMHRPSPSPVTPHPQAVEGAPAAVEDAPAAVEDAPAAVEAAPVTAEAAPAAADSTSIEPRVENGTSTEEPVATQGTTEDTPQAVVPAPTTEGSAADEQQADTGPPSSKVDADGSEESAESASTKGEGSNE